MIFYINGLSEEKANKYKISLDIEKCAYSNFERKGNWTEQLEKNKGEIMGNKVSIMMDSGAPSFYNKFVRQMHDGKSSHMGSHMKDRKHDDFSFVESKEYRVYLRNYVLFIKKHLDILDIYVNLDVVNNAEETWKNQQFMEARGLKPIPVWHFGTDRKWLEMYLEKGYDYIAIGGIVPNPPKVVIPPLDEIWEELLTDKDGMPVVKVHGFAVTTLALITRWPWYSCDSASWVKYGKYGVVCVPKWQKKKWNYLLPPFKVTVSERSPSKTEIGGVHINSFSPFVREHIFNYWKENGWELGESEFRWEVEGYKKTENEGIATRDKENKRVEVELRTVNGLCNDYKKRDEANIKYYLGLEKQLPKWPWAFIPEKKRKKGFFQI